MLIIKPRLLWIIAYILKDYAVYLRRWVSPINIIIVNVFRVPCQRSRIVYCRHYNTIQSCDIVMATGQKCEFAHNNVCQPYYVFVGPNLFGHFFFFFYRFVMSNVIIGFSNGYKLDYLRSIIEIRTSVPKRTLSPTGNGLGTVVR